MPSDVCAGGWLQTPMLLDSGADVSILDEQYGEELGFDLDALPEVPLGDWSTADEGIEIVLDEEDGAVPDAEQPEPPAGRTGREAEVTFNLCGQLINARVVFAENADSILGREGVFERLRILFLHGNTLVRADPHP